MRPLPRHLAAGAAFGAALGLAGLAFAAPDAAVEGVSDPALRALIEQAMGDARAPPRGILDARRRAIEAARDAVALLRSEGYYESAATPDVATTPQVRPLVRITLGPRFRLGPSAIDWRDGPPDAASQASARDALRLTPGAPGRAADILAAEGRMVAALRKRGYAEAAIQPRQVVVDHADGTVRPTFRIAAGPRVRLGPVSLGPAAPGAPAAAGGKKRAKDGMNDRTRARWVVRLAPWKAGATYDPALLAKLEKRLLDTGAYESASVALAPASPAPGPGASVEPRPVRVTLVDRPPHALELGAGYSTTEGSGIDAKWTTYNRLGRADSLILTAKLYDIQQKLDLEQDLPDWGRADQTLKFGGGFLGDRTPAYDDLGGGVRVDVIRKAELTNSISLGGSLDYASTREKTAVNLLATPVGVNLNLLIATVRAGFTLDRSNSLLDPGRGWRLEVEAEPTLITGDRTLEYLRTQAQLTGYLPLGGGWPVVAARAKIGSILGGSIPDVPADRRFFAGGGGSVRGYGYQDVGSQLSDSTPEGGLSVVEGSVEIRQRLSRAWGVVAFADAGDIGESSAPRLDGMEVGVGVGLRYDPGLGPLRLDIGTPVNPRHGDSPIQVYISIGQAF